MLYGTNSLYNVRIRVPEVGVGKVKFKGVTGSGDFPLNGSYGKNVPELFGTGGIKIPVVRSVSFRILV